MPFYPRRLYASLKDHMKESSVTVLTGMRRTGKTTLIRQLLTEIPSDNKLYLDLERLDNRELFSEKNYDTIVYSLKQRGLTFNGKIWIALDEIQLVPNLPSVIKYLYDHYEIKWLITGSSSFYLKNLFHESLAGRKKIFELYPLDFSEFLDFKEIPNQRKDQSSGFPFFPNLHIAEYERLKVYYEEYIHYGGFPEVVLSSQTSQKEDILKDIVSSYVNMDIQLLSDFRKKNKLLELMRLLATRAGNRIDITELGRVLGLSRFTIESYITFFESTYLITRIPVHTNSPDREIVKAKKLYFHDNGILNTLGEVGSGIQFENAIYTQLRRVGDIRYYARKNGQEIDFVVSGKLGLEAKERPTGQDDKHLRQLATSAGIAKARLVGRHLTSGFSNYTWGGEI